MDDQFEQYASVESGSVRGGPPGRLVAVVVAALGVAVLAFIGFRITGAASGTAAGADTSTEAVTGLMDALSSENVIETFALLPPSEVGHAVELYVPGVDLAQQSEVLVSDDPLAGIDITVVGGVTRVEELHPEIHRVYLNSDAVVRVVTDPTKMDPAIAEGAEASDETMTAEEFLSEFNDGNESDALAEPFVVAVRERGQWFVSPLYTSMEYLREYYDVEVPDFSASREIASVGAGSPQGVLEQILEPIDDLDEMDVIDALDEAIASLEEGTEADFMADYELGTSLVAPDEIDVFIDYAPVFAAITEEVQMSTDELFESNGDVESWDEVPLADVYVVSADIERGTAADVAKATSIELRRIPREFYPANALTEMSQIDGKVALSDLPANKILVLGDFVDPPAEGGEAIPETDGSAHEPTIRWYCQDGRVLDRPEDDCHMIVENDVYPGEDLNDSADKNYCVGGLHLNIEGEPCIPGPCSVDPNYCDPNFDDYAYYDDNYPDPYYDDPYYDDSYYEEAPTLIEMLEEMRAAVVEADYKGSLDLEFDTLVESMTDERAKVSVTDAQLHGELSWQDPGMPRSSFVLDADIYRGICGRFLLEATDVVEYEGEPPESFTESGNECMEFPIDPPAGAFIMTREIDGQWYFSPIETIVEYARFAIEMAAAEG